MSVMHIETVNKSEKYERKRDNQAVCMSLFEKEKNNCPDFVSCVIKTVAYPIQR
jgi:hypothetical protein